MRRTTRRKLAVVLAVGCLAIGGALGVTVPASASVENPGSFTFSVSSGMFAIGSLRDPLPPVPMDGQIDASGAFSIPQSNLSNAFGPSEFSVGPNEAVTFHGSTDVTSLSGTLDPSSGAATLTTSIFTNVSYELDGIFGSFDGTCSIGASAAHLPITLTTATPGVPYDDETGTVTLAVDLGGQLSCGGGIPDSVASLLEGADQLILSGTMTPILLPNDTRLALSATSLDLGQQVVGTASPTRSVTVTNTGPTSLTVSGTSASGDFAADASSCTAQPVPAGQACVINLTFSPTATGLRSGALTITSNADSSPDTVALTGTGVAPVTAAAPGSIAFGSVPVGTFSAPQAVTVSNLGSSDLHVSGASASGPFVISADGCSGAGGIAPGKSCPIAVQFAPVSTGAASGTLAISGDGGTASVALSGSGSPSADLSVSIGAGPNPVHKNKDLTYTITVHNAGTSAATAVLAVDQLPANVQFLSLSGPAGASCVTPAVGATGTVKCSLGPLAAGASVQLQIVSAVVAAKDATISNTVQVSSGTFDPDPQDNHATVSTAVK